MIGEGLRRKGVPEHLTKVIENLYFGCATNIRTRDEGVRNELKRVVKQGDPLSPLLFHLAMESILKRLTNDTQGINMDGEHRIAALAFADDLIMVGKDRDEAQNQLELLDNYLTTLGMSLAYSKCAAFEIKARRKTWLIKDPKLTMRNENIRYVQPDETFPYLGALYSPWAGIRKGTAIQNVMKAIRGLRRICLKPWQKIEIPQKYLIPRYIYILTTSPSAQTIMRL